MHPVVAVAVQTTTNKTASAVIGVVILGGLVVGIVVLAIVNARSSRRSLQADAEVRRLRDEVVALRSWIAQQAAAPARTPEATPTVVASVPAPGPTPVPPAAAYPLVTAVPADWYADPTGRHQLRYWDGSTWTTHVADHGVVGTD